MPNFAQSSTKLRTAKTPGQCIMRERPRKNLVEDGWVAEGSWKKPLKNGTVPEGKTPLDANDLSPREATK